MDQEKIGKFISTIRKEQNMTQKDLAEKLGISINAVSKWERGICLMDISLLKPLSKLLNVSVIEIINGERLSLDTAQIKTEEAIENTITYSNKKIKKVRKKNRFIILAIVIIALISLFFCYKGLALYILTAEPLEDFIYEKFTTGLNNQDVMKITYEPVLDNNYIVYDDIKLKNNFSAFIKADNTEEYEMFKYHLYDENNNVISSFWFSKMNEYVDLLTNDSIIIHGLSEDDIKGNVIEKNNIFQVGNSESFLEKNNITNDIDFFQFVKDHPYLKNNIFTSVKEMKVNYAYNTFVNIISTSLKKFTVIEGKYDGYMFTYDYNYPTKEVNILKNNKRYIFTFIGEEFTDSYIQDLLNTLVIS